MGHWNHRVMRHEHNGEVWYAIHEVHYDMPGDSGKMGWSEGDYGTSPIGESVEDVRWMLERMLEALDKPVLDYDGESVNST